MEVTHSSAEASIEEKNGKHYVSITVSVLTDTGHNREESYEILAPIEEWDKTNLRETVVNRLKTNEPPVNKSSEPTRDFFKN